MGEIDSTDFNNYGLILAGDTVITAGDTDVHADGTTSVIRAMLADGKLQIKSGNWT